MNRSGTPNAANKPADRIPLTVVSGAGYAERERWIAEDCLHHPRAAVILEGLPTGGMPLSDLPTLHVQRIAPGCFCCIGHLPLRVSLNRALRQGARFLYLGVASQEHLDNLKHTLQQAPYDQLLLADSFISL
ncbi:GTPase [Undibacterium griseum]|uniref:GTPase n=1 Tax=Undibacterium griseum TaxID=2762295 RepID=UPI001E42D096|nr:GTPase [Undibacterium griseum]